MGYSECIGRETSSRASAPGPRGACQIVGNPRPTPPLLTAMTTTLPCPEDADAYFSQAKAIELRDKLTAAKGRSVNALVMPEQRFQHGWRLLCRTWHKNGHCLRLGCGRETLAGWVRESCHELYPAWFYRQVLMEACSRGWATKRQSNSGHSIFIIKA